MSILLNALRKKKQIESGDDSSLDDLSDDLERNDLERNDLDFSEGNNGINKSNNSNKLLFAAMLIIFLIALIAIGISLFTLSKIENNDRQGFLDITLSEQAEEDFHPSSKESLNANIDKAVVEDKKIIPKVESEKADNESASKAVSDQSIEQYFEIYQPTEVVNKNNTHQDAMTENRSKIEENESKSESYNSELGYQGSQSTRTYTTKSLNKQLPIRTIDDLNDVEQLMINELIIDAHIYSENPENRFVFVDGAMKLEGEQLINSWYLEAIEQNSIIVNNNILRIRIPQ